MTGGSLRRRGLGLALAGARFAAPVLGRLRTARDPVYRLCVAGLAAGVSGRALAAARAVAESMPDPIWANRFSVLYEANRPELGVDRARWARVVAHAFDVVEDAIETGRVAETVDLTFEAMALLFHPRIQQSGESAPLLEGDSGDPALRALLGHRVLERIRAGIQRGQREPRTDPPNAPMRLLVLTDSSMAFMGGLLDHWAQDDRFEVRVRELGADSEIRRWVNLRNTVADRLLGRIPTVPDSLAVDLQWADVVFSEWGAALSVRLSSIDFAGRLVVRLHRYEAQTMMPQLMDWRAVDDLILVNEDVREVMRRALPGIEERTRVAVLPNVVDLSRFARGKLPESERTIGLVGYSRVKDPMWALDVLDALRRRDPSWRLLLVGQDPRDSADARDAAYFTALDARIKEFGSAVERLGARDDMPEVYRRVGVILSTSLIESTHLALLEGAASGAVPIVRDWPWSRRIGGARRIYPADWIVDDPEAAALRILEHSSPLGETGVDKDSAAWVRVHCDAEAIASRYDALLLTPADTEHGEGE